MLLLVGAFALAFQTGVQVGPPSRRRDPVVKDSTTTDTTTRRGTRRVRGVRQAVSAELAASAFKDPLAATTLRQARVARVHQDSALVAYDAMSYSRISVGMGFTSIGRDRLMFRHESAARVQWRSGVGAWVDVKGVRTAVPAAQSGPLTVQVETDNDPDLAAAIPYYPGYEPLWVGGNMARAQVDETEIVNPLADGSEAYYTYETGDSLSFRLPDATTIRIRELKIRPREPKWNLVVGSLWFDTASGQLVRAAYRLSIPMDIWSVAKSEDPKSMNDVPIWVRPMITPMKAEVTAIAIEYSLHEGRFWLPKARVADATAQVSFMHLPVKMEESFTYASVNGTDSLPKIAPPPPPANAPPDSLKGPARQDWLDSSRAATRVRVRAQNDSVRRGLKKPTRRVNQCDTASFTQQSSRRMDGTVLVATRIPCDTIALAHSADLPASIFDPGEELFGSKDLEAMEHEALSMSAQAPFIFDPRHLPAPTIEYGPSMMRYNRVEGLSIGASAVEQLGGGYSGEAIGRFGLSDREPNVELIATRSNLSEAVHLAGYNKLVSASDWGHPLSFGSSFSALAFARDEGFYYRASGLELGGERDAPFGGGIRLDWRAFVERERTAAVNTTFALDGGEFPDNITARRGTYTGAGVRLDHSYGLDPDGFRAFTNLRLEVANGDSAYGRGALDVTLSRALGNSLAGALTLAGGSSVGALPAQRRWYLGGSQTIRGQSPDTAQSGNAFWMTRMELGARGAGARPTVFGDLGWAGDRSKLSEVGRPLSGVGAGMSFLDGLFRFDVARGIYPRKQFRVDMYLEAKF